MIGITLYEQGLAYARAAVGDYWQYHERRAKLVREYSWAIPSRKALACIKSFASRTPNGIVEIGAGTGFWAALLQELGVDVVAYERVPVESGRNFYFNKVSTWTPVLPGDATMARLHPDRTLFLCWPPQHPSTMAEDALRHYQGDSLAYIGEELGHNGETVYHGGNGFHALLASDWQLVGREEVEQWAECGVRDYLWFYERRLSAR